MHPSYVPSKVLCKTKKEMSERGMDNDDKAETNNVYKYITVYNNI